MSIKTHRNTQCRSEWHWFYNPQIVFSTLLSSRDVQKSSAIANKDRRTPTPSQAHEIWLRVKFLVRVCQLQFQKILLYRCLSLCFSSAIEAKNATLRSSASIATMMVATSTGKPVVDGELSQKTAPKTFPLSFKPSVKKHIPPFL